MFARTKNSATITFNEPLQIVGTDMRLQPGDYKVTWNGSGPDVQVSFLQSGETIETVPAKLVNQPTPYDEALDIVKGDNNSTIVNAIEWRELSLVFNEQPASGD